MQGVDYDNFMRSFRALDDKVQKLATQQKEIIDLLARVVAILDNISKASPSENVSGGASHGPYLQP